MNFRLAWYNSDKKEVKLMKTIKKSLSIIVSLAVFAAVFAVFPASANFGDENHMRDITEVVTSQDNTKQYRFYMPDEWKNEYNDRYDGQSLSSCCAGIFWWDGTKNCSMEEYKVYDEGAGWPGYAVSAREAADPCIFIAEVPADVETIIWNNAVTNHNDKENAALSEAAVQTQIINCLDYAPGEDEYGFYPSGVDSFDGMIFVCELGETTQSEYVLPKTYNGEWFYYYGNGQYGVNKSPVDGEVYSGGRWPGRDKADEPATWETTVPATESTANQETTVPATTPAPKQQQTVAPVKRPNTVKITVKNRKLSKSTLKKSKTKVKLIKVKNAKGKVSYKLVKKGTSGKILKKISVNKTTGAVTFKKGAYKKGSYKIKIKITVTGDKNYDAKFTKTARVIIK
jgi:hypothetical protein